MFAKCLNIGTKAELKILQDNVLWTRVFEKKRLASCGSYILWDLDQECRRAFLLDIQDPYTDLTTMYQDSLYAFDLKLSRIREHASIFHVVLKPWHSKADASEIYLIGAQAVLISKISDNAITLQVTWTGGKVSDGIIFDFTDLCQ
jgi:hypothetical protein